MSENVPNYPRRPHKSGQARVKIKGKDVWLGAWNSPKSRTKYARIVAELSASGGAVVDRQQKGRSITVVELIEAFRAWAEQRYQKNGKATSEVGMYKSALAPVIELYGDTLASDFGPLALLACRDKLKTQHCRTKVNAHLGRIRRVWKFGVSRQLVHESTWNALKAVEGLRRGEAKDPPKVTCVADSAVAAIESLVPPTVWTMIKIQLYTGMRPGEVCLMRTSDILQDDPTLPKEVRTLCWTYRPHSHKTEHHERGRLILLGPHAQKLLEPWLRPAAPNGYLFSPREAAAYYLAKKAAARKSKRYGKRPTKKNPQRSPRDVYTNFSYNRSIAKACKRAAIAKWCPNRLRHNAATLVRKLYGIELARIILGHSTVATSELYAEVDLEKAARAMSAIG